MTSRRELHLCCGWKARCHRARVKRRFPPTRTAAERGFSCVNTADCERRAGRWAAGVEEGPPCETLPGRGTHAPSVLARDTWPCWLQVGAGC